VSSDRRIRKAAQRRKARALTSDQFLDVLDRLRTKPPAGMGDAGDTPDGSTDRPEPLPKRELEYWLEEFGDLDLMLEAQQAGAPDAPLLTDAEIARIRREVEGEA